MAMTAMLPFSMMVTLDKGMMSIDPKQAQCTLSPAFKALITPNAPIDMITNVITLTIIGLRPDKYKRPKLSSMKG